MRKLSITFILGCFFICKTGAQEYFTITNYDVTVKVNKDASLDIYEKLQVHFTEPRHGIIRKIPYKYKLQDLPAGTERASLPMQSGGYNHTIVGNIKVSGWNFETGNEGDYKVIRIGSADKTVSGDQQYIITYRVSNAINFFKDHSELYFNLIGNEWATMIRKVRFQIDLPEILTDTTNYFIATGITGSKANDTKAGWDNNRTFSGRAAQQLNPYEGITIGISFPAGYLVKADYRFRGMYWLLLPLFVFASMFYIWKRWGKDDEVVVQTEYYPPDNISPGISGYIIDGRLDRRDLTALIPYWGAGGYLQINETEEKHLLGLFKTKEFEFVKLKNLPDTALTYEKTIFNGIFRLGDRAKLKDLKNILYTYMNKARQELQAEVDRNEYYVKYSRGFAVVLLITGGIVSAFGFIKLLSYWYENKWMGIAIIASGIFIIIFGALMSKKSAKGTVLYQKLAGFKEFIKSVEKDRLREFLKQDQNYFDKVLPYAIVFNVADTWKDKLKGLDIPPPTWYHGSYAGSNFNTMMFMNSLDHSMKEMTSTFYSAPQSSGSSGGSFGSGGSSGGGFGGGGGSSW